MNSHANTDIRKKAKKGIDKADDTTVKMILAILEVQEQEAEEETELEKEINRRFDDYEQGKVIPISWNELEKRVKENHKKRMKSI